MIEKWIINKALYWELLNNEVFVYSSDYEYRRKIDVPEPHKLFEFLLFLKTPKSLNEIFEFKYWNTEEKKLILNFLISKNYLIIHDESISEYNYRLQSFINTLPNSSFSEYQKKNP